MHDLTTAPLTFTFEVVVFFFLSRFSSLTPFHFGFAWCNGYRHRKLTHSDEIISWMRYLHFT